MAEPDEVVVNVSEEELDLQTKSTDEEFTFKDYVPMGVTSFDQLDKVRSAQDQAEQIYEVTSDFMGLAREIIVSQDVTDKGKAIQDLAKEFSSRVSGELESQKEVNSDTEPYYEDMDMNVKAVWTTAYVNNLPDSAFLFVQSGGKKDGEGKTVPRNYRHFPVKDASGKYDPAHVRNAIGRIPQSNAPGLNKDAVQKRAQRILASLKKESGTASLLERVITAVKEVLGQDDEPVDETGMMIWKEADGQWHWLARYSNNFLDVDNPPQIISAKSHKDFVKSVDDGEWPLPELWLWHVPEWRVGKATAVFYDDVDGETGFAGATGVFDKDKSDVAEWLAKQEDVAVSHGMPNSTIVTDPSEPSVIVKHRTAEISPLPRWAAANKLTDFFVMDMEEADMAIPQEKRKALLDQWHMSEDLLDKLEKANVESAAKAKSEGVAHKEVGDEPEQTTTTETETSDAAVQTTTTETETNDAPEYVTRSEVADALGEVLKPILDQMSALAGQVKEIGERIETVNKTEDERVKEALSKTPPASLGALIAERVIGSEAARIDGRSSLAKQKPTEAEDSVKQVIGVPFLDKLLSGQTDAAEVK